MYEYISFIKDNDALLLDGINENENAFIINDIAIDASPANNQIGGIWFGLTTNGRSQEIE